MRKALLLVGATAVLIVLMAGSLLVFGGRSVLFAFLAVWLPMTWLGTVSRLVTPRLPERCHALRSFERDGRMYELIGVRLVKALLRRGPLAVFNPDLHLPAEQTPMNLAYLDQRMRDAEASHFLLLVAMLGLVVHAAVRGWWGTAGWILLFDVLINGYPVLLQRYNRARLNLRFDLQDSD